MFVLPDAVAEGTTHVEVEDVTLEALLDGIETTKTAARKNVARRLH